MSGQKIICALQALYNAALCLHAQDFHLSIFAIDIFAAVIFIT